MSSYTASRGGCTDDGCGVARRRPLLEEPEAERLISDALVRDRSSLSVDELDRDARLSRGPCEDEEDALVRTMFVEPIQ